MKDPLVTGHEKLNLCFFVLNIMYSVADLAEVGRINMPSSPRTATEEERIPKDLRNTIYFHVLINVS